MTNSFRNFLIVGTQRTGSSALADYIDSREDMACGWEWSQRAAPWNQIKLAKLGLKGNFSSLEERHQKHMQRSATAQCRWLGFRRLFRASDKWVIHPRFSPALLIDRLDAHINWLVRHPDIHIIHIVRRDNIEWLKSKYVSRAAGSYVGKKYPEELKVVIPVASAIARLRSKHWVDYKLAKLERTNNYLRVPYEMFLEQPEIIKAATLEFFGIDKYSATGDSKIARQSQHDASDYITNYSELKSALHENNLLLSHLQCDRSNQGILP